MGTFYWCVKVFATNMKENYANVKELLEKFNIFSKYISENFGTKNRFNF